MQPPLSFPQVYRCAINAGFSPPNAVIATAIAFAESSGIPDNLHVNTDQWNSTDWGLMMINDHWQANAFQRYSQLKTDPQQSMDAAHDIFVAANNSFTPWATYKSNKYARYLAQAQGASSAPVDTLTKLHSIANAIVGKKFQGSTVVAATVNNSPGQPTGQYVLITTADGQSWALYPDGHVSQTAGPNTPAPPHFNWFERLFNIAPVIPGARTFGQGNQALEQAYHDAATGPLNVGQNPISDSATDSINGVGDFFNNLFSMGELGPYLWIGGGAILCVLGVMIMAKGDIGGIPV